ncbi:hypothetical protein CRYUN_Cryun05aG0179300 [Craigia yunnanensis]
MAMKNTLASIWRLVKGVCIRDINPALFLFQFFHELDIERVIKGGPWTFNQHLLITSRLKVGDNPNQIPLYFTDFWIQVYDLPYGFMSERVGKEICNFVGMYVEADANNFSGIWRNFRWILVTIDVRKPLKRMMKIKKQRGDWSWINFKYERLSTFFFFCGIIGYNEKL